MPVLSFCLYYVQYPFIFFKYIMTTLRYRTSDNWEKLHIVEVPTHLKALELAYEFSIGDFGISLGDISIDGQGYLASEIETILTELDKRASLC